MIQFVGDQCGEDGTRLRSFFCCRYCGENLPPLPWGDQVFDCILVSADNEEARRLAGPFSNMIVKHSVDFVQTTGTHAELLHDWIDEASVLNGVEDDSGDGLPMTSWHEDALSLDEMSEVAELCFGSADRVLCVVVGSEEDQRAFIDRLRWRLAEGR